MSRPTVVAVTAIALLGCPSRKAVEVPAAPTPAATMPTSAPDVAAEVDVPTRWGRAPTGLSADDTMAGTLRHDGDEVVLAIGPAAFSVPAALEFSDCLEGPGPIGPAPTLDLKTVDSRPAWVGYTGGDEGVMLRLTPYGAQLFTDDGCLRSANLGDVLFAGADSTDTLFGADEVIPGQAAEIASAEAQFSDVAQPPVTAGGPLLRGDQRATLSVGPLRAELQADHESLLSLEYATTRLKEWHTAFAAHGDRDARWYTFTLSAELALDAGDLSREDSVTWAWVDAKPHRASVARVLFANSPPDYEDSLIEAERVAVTPAGVLRVTGRRIGMADVRMIGAGRCPEMEGVLEFRFRDERARWELLLPNGRTHHLGTTTRRVTEASGCLEEAKKASKVPKFAHEGVNSAVIRTQMSSSWPSPSPPSTAIHGP